MKLARKLLVVPMVLTFVAALSGVASAQSETYLGTCTNGRGVFPTVTAPYLHWSVTGGISNNALKLTNYSAAANAGSECNPSEAQVYVHKIITIEHWTLTAHNSASFSCGSFTISDPPGLTCTYSGGSTQTATFTKKTTCTATTSKGIAQCNYSANQVTIKLNSGTLTDADGYMSGNYFDAKGDEYDLNEPA